MYIAVVDSRYLDGPALVRLCAAALYLAWPHHASLPPPGLPPVDPDGPLASRGLVWCQAPTADVIASALPDASHALLVHTLLTELCVRNRDRFGLLIDTIRPHMTAWLHAQWSAGPTLTVHYSVSGLYDLCAKLLALGQRLSVDTVLAPVLLLVQRAGVSSDDATLLQHLALHNACGVRTLLAPPLAVLLQSSKCWITLVDIASSCLANSHSGRCVTFLHVPCLSVYPSLHQHRFSMFI